MKMINKLIWAGAMLMTGGMVKADHNSPSGSVNRLLYETQELVQTVRYVGLNYNVQQSVDRFNYDVYQLANCVRFNGGRGLRNSQLTVGDHLDSPDIRDHMEGVGIPYQCRMNLDMTRRSFVPVERYLRDTYYDFPQVYRSYMETREALYSLQVGGFPGPMPGPGPSPYPNPLQQITCIAVDGGWEEHGGGHPGYGYDVYTAQRMAIQSCQRFHGRCRINQCR